MFSLKRETSAALIVSLLSITPQSANAVINAAELEVAEFKLNGNSLHKQPNGRFVAKLEYEGEEGSYWDAEHSASKGKEEEDCFDEGKREFEIEIIPTGLSKPEEQYQLGVRFNFYSPGENTPLMDSYEEVESVLAPQGLGDITRDDYNEETLLTTYIENLRELNNGAAPLHLTWNYNNQEIRFFNRFAGKIPEITFTQNVPIEFDLQPRVSRLDEEHSTVVMGRYRATEYNFERAFHMRSIAHEVEGGDGDDEEHPAEMSEFDAWVHGFLCRISTDGAGRTVPAQDLRYLSHGTINHVCFVKWRTIPSELRGWGEQNGIENSDYWSPVRSPQDFQDIAFEGFEWQDSAYYKVSAWRYEDSDVLLSDGNGRFFPLLKIREEWRKVTDELDRNNIQDQDVLRWSQGNDELGEPPIAVTMFKESSIPLVLPRETAKRAINGVFVEGTTNLPYGVYHCTDRTISPAGERRETWLEKKDYGEPRAFELTYNGDIRRFFETAELGAGLLNDDFEEQLNAVHNYAGPGGRILRHFNLQEQDGPVDHRELGIRFLKMLGRADADARGNASTLDFGDAPLEEEDFALLMEILPRLTVDRLRLRPTTEQILPLIRGMRNVPTVAEVHVGELDINEGGRHLNPDDQVALLSFLERVRNLRTARFNNPVDPANSQVLLQRLAHFPELASLTLERVNLVGHGPSLDAAFRGLPGLRELSLVGCRLDGAVFQDMARLNDLTALNLNRSRFMQQTDLRGRSNLVSNIIRTNPHLNRLDLSGTMVANDPNTRAHTIGLLERIHAAQNLQVELDRLDLNNQTLTPGQVTSLLGALEKIQGLRILDLGQVIPDRENARELLRIIRGHHTDITRLNLNRLKLQGCGTELSQTLEDLASLNQLYLLGSIQAQDLNQRLHNSIVAHRLQYLNLSNINFAGNESKLINLISALPNLRWLAVQQTQFSESEKVRFGQILSQRQHLRTLCYDMPYAYSNTRAVAGNAAWFGAKSGALLTVLAVAGAWQTGGASFAVQNLLGGLTIFGGGGAAAGATAGAAAGAVIDYRGTAVPAGSIPAAQTIARIPHLEHLYLYGTATGNIFQVLNQVIQRERNRRNLPQLVTHRQ